MRPFEEQEAREDNQGNVVNTGRYQALMEVQDGVNKGFARQAGLL